LGKLSFLGKAGALAPARRGLNLRFKTWPPAYPAQAELERGTLQTKHYLGKRSFLGKAGALAPARRGLNLRFKTGPPAYPAQAELERGTLPNSAERNKREKAALS
jgi:hypothetical protein